MREDDPNGLSDPEHADPLDRRSAGRASSDSAATGADDADAAAPDRSEQYLRLAADFENFRRRKAQETAALTRYASEEAARQLLPVLDNLQRAVDHAPDETGGLADGVRMVLRDLEAALERLGVVPIEAVGQPFDPTLHEAIGGEESDDVEVDTVSAEFQRGYRLHDRLIRPALVRVAHPAATSGSEAR